jgi:hypothetical protein
VAEETLVAAKADTAVKAADKLHDEIESMKTYMEDSIYLNIDPYHENTATLLYTVSDVSPSNEKAVTEDYLAYVNTGGLSSRLLKNSAAAKGMDETSLSELLQAYEAENGKQSAVTSVETGDAVGGCGSVFYVKVIGSKQDMVEELAEDVKTSLEQYAATVRKKSGTHKITLLSFQMSEQVDRDLEEDIWAFNEEMTNAQDALDAAVSNFSSEQTQLYNALLQEKGYDVQSEQDGGTTRLDVLKRAIIGAALGMVLYIFIYSILYVYGGMMESGDDVARRYSVRILGQIEAGKSSGRQDIYRESQRNTITQLKWICEERRIDTVCTSIVSSPKEEYDTYMDDLSKESGQQKITLVWMKDILQKTDQWKKLKEVGYVIPVYTTGKTRYKDIEKELRFYRENNIQVLGVIILEK